MPLLGRVFSLHWFKLALKESRIVDCIYDSLLLQKQVNMKAVLYALLQELISIHLPSLQLLDDFRCALTRVEIGHLKALNEVALWKICDDFDSHLPRIREPIQPTLLLVLAFDQRIHQHDWQSAKVVRLRVAGLICLCLHADDRVNLCQFMRADHLGLASDRL